MDSLSHSLSLAGSSPQLNSGQSLANARVWSGPLPPPSMAGRTSSKVFVAPVPWQLLETQLLAKFAKFEPRCVLWTRGSGGADSGRCRDRPCFCYIVLRSARAVAQLLTLCHKGRYRGMDVVPWYLDDAIYVNALEPTETARDPKRTVFVGGLHGKVTAAGLATVCCGLFGQVTHVCLDTDRFLYPTGSGQVTFASPEAYRLAVQCRFVLLQTDRFQKTVQIEPFLVKSPCMLCHRQLGPLFCREFKCFGYFCFQCWHKWHAILQLTDHNPITR